MTTATSDVWARNQRDISNIATYISIVKEVDPDKFLHLGGLINFVSTRDGKSFYPQATEHGFLYWVEDKTPKKCSFNRKTQEYTVDDFSYPQPMSRVFDYFKGLLCGIIPGGTSLVTGEILASEKIVKWDLQTLPPWLIAGILTIIPAYAFVGAIDAGRRDSTDHNTQELGIDREAWKAYRRSPFGRRFS